MNRERLKIIGFYILAAFVIARIMITPLQHSLQEKKNVLKEYEDTYKMRMLSYERYKAQEKGKNRESAGAIEKFLKSLYAGDVPFSTIQSEMVEKISALAEKEGLTLLSFEFPDPVSFKAVSEVPVVVRLNGQQKGVVALLGEIEKDSRTLVVKRFEDSKTGQYASQCVMTISAFRLEKYEQVKAEVKVKTK